MTIILKSPKTQTQPVGFGTMTNKVVVYLATSSSVDTHCCTSLTNFVSTLWQFSYLTNLGLLLLHTMSNFKNKCTTGPVMQPVDNLNTLLNYFIKTVSREFALTLFNMTALNNSIHGTPKTQRSFGDLTNTSRIIRNKLLYYKLTIHIYNAGTFPLP